MPNLTSVTVKLNLPYIGGIEGTWKPDESERHAAWEMYVELVTRVAIAELPHDEGLLREVLTSYYSLFETTRTILRKYGPSVAKPNTSNELSFGYLAITILNTVIRPMLSKWHPRLLDYENTRDLAVSQVAHERQWEKYDELRLTVDDSRDRLVEYANILARVVDVPLIITDVNPE